MGLAGFDPDSCHGPRARDVLAGAFCAGAVHGRQVLHRHAAHSAPQLGLGRDHLPRSARSVDGQRLLPAAGAGVRDARLPGPDGSPQPAALSPHDTAAASSERRARRGSAVLLVPQLDHGWSFGAALWIAPAESRCGAVDCGAQDRPVHVLRPVLAAALPGLRTACRADWPRRLETLRRFAVHVRVRAAVQAHGLARGRSALGFGLLATWAAAWPKDTD